MAEEVDIFLLDTVSPVSFGSGQSAFSFEKSESVGSPGSGKSDPNKMATTDDSNVDAAAKTPEPRFGGWVRDGTKAVWIGGAPTTDWSGTVNKSYASPLCFHANDPNVEAKSYLKHTESSLNKFKHDDPEYSLLSFCADEAEHAKLHGMDTGFYIKPGDANGDGAEDLFGFHSKYTKKMVEEFVDECLNGPKSGGTQKFGGKFDEEGIRALMDSGARLMNRLDEDIKNAIRHELPLSPTGPTVLMAIVHEVKATSLQRAEDVAEKFRNMKLSDFKGENVQD